MLTGIKKIKKAQGSSNHYTVMQGADEGDLTVLSGIKRLAEIINLLKDKAVQKNVNKKNI